MNTALARRRRGVAAILGTVAIVVLATAPSLANNPTQTSTSTGGADQLESTLRDARHDAEPDEANAAVGEESGDDPDKAGPLGDSRVHEAVEDEQGEDGAEADDQGQNASADEDQDENQAAEDEDADEAEEDDGESAGQDEEHEDESDNDGGESDDD